MVQTQFVGGSGDAVDGAVVADFRPGGLWLVHCVPPSLVFLFCFFVRSPCWGERIRQQAGSHSGDVESGFACRAGSHGGGVEGALFREWGLLPTIQPVLGAASVVSKCQYMQLTLSFPVNQGNRKTM